MSAFLQTLNISLKSSIIDTEKIIGLLTFNDLSPSDNFTSISNTIISNPDLLKNPRFIDMFRSLVDSELIKIDSDESFISDIKNKYCNYNSFEKGVMIKSQNNKIDESLIIGENDKTINYHVLSSPVFNNQKVIFKLTTGFYSRQSGKSKFNNVQFIPVTFEIDSIKIKDNNGDEYCYEYIIRLVSDSYLLPTGHAGNDKNIIQPRKKLLKSILEVLGINYISPTNYTNEEITFVNDSYFTNSEDSSRIDQVFTNNFPARLSKPYTSFIRINTFPKLSELSKKYNDKMSSIKGPHGELLSDFIGLSYINNDLIIVPETFKIYSRHVAKIFHSGVFIIDDLNVIEKYRTQLSTAVEEFNTSLGFSTKSSSPIVMNENKGKLTISFDQLLFEFEKGITTTLIFSFNSSEEENVKKYVSKIMSNFIEFIDNNEMGTKLGLSNNDYNISYNSPTNQRSNVYVKFNFIEQMKFFNGYEDKLFILEHLLNQYFTSLLYGEDKIFMIDTKNDFNENTESFTKFIADENTNKMHRLNDLRLNYNKYQANGFFSNDHNNKINLSLYVDSLNKIYNVMLFIFITGSMKQLSKNGIQSEVKITEFLYSQILRTKREIYENTFDMYLFTNFGFEDNNQKSSSFTYGAMKYDTLNGYNFSNYLFSKVETVEYCQLKSIGNTNNINTILVEHDIGVEPILDSKSDKPLNVISISLDKKIYMMSRYNPILKFQNSSIKKRNVNVSSELKIDDLSTFLVAEIKYQNIPVINHATLLRFYIESINYDSKYQMMIFDFLESYNSKKSNNISDIIYDLSISNSEFGSFFQNLYTESNILGLNQQSIYRASEHLSNSDFWIFSFMNNMIKSFAKPTNDSKYPIFNNDIINLIYQEKNSSSINYSEDENKTIDFRFIVDNQFNEDEIKRDVYIKVIYKYLNKTFVKEDIGSIFENYNVEITDISNKICIILDNDITSLFLNKTFDLEHSRGTVKFISRINDEILPKYDSTFSEYFDALFELTTNYDDINELISSYINSNVFYNGVYDSFEANLKNVSIVSSIKNGTNNIIQFSLPFEIDDKKLYLKNSELTVYTNDELSNGIIKLKTKSCNLIFREKDENTIENNILMLNVQKLVNNGILSDSNIEALKITCWSGLTRLTDLSLDNDFIDQRESMFFTVYTESINKNYNFATNIGPEVLLSPCNYFCLYTTILKYPETDFEIKSKTGKIGRSKLYNSFILNNIINANNLYISRKLFSKNDNYSPEDVQNLYKSENQYKDFTNSMILINDTGIETKVYSYYNLNSNNESTSNFVSLNDTSDDKYSAQSLKEQYKRNFASISNNEKILNLTFDISINQSSNVYNNLKYSNTKPYDWYKFSDDKNVLALVNTESVQLFIRVGSIYKHISTLNVIDIKSITFGSTMFIITSTETCPESNKLWIIATGKETLITFPGYIPMVGDRVNGTVIIDGFPKFVNDTLITKITKPVKVKDRLKFESFTFYSENNIITDIVPLNSKNLFYFSKSCKYLMVNSFNTLKTSDTYEHSNLINMINLNEYNITNSNGVINKDLKMPMFKFGEWKIEDGHEYFYGISIDDSLFCVIPHMNAIYSSEYKFNLPTSYLTTGIKVHNYSRSPNVIAIFDKIKNCNGFWLYDLYIEHDNKNVMIYYNNNTMSKFDIINDTKFRFQNNSFHMNSEMNFNYEFIRNCKLVVEDFKVVSLSIGNVKIIKTKSNLNIDEYDLPIINNNDTKLYLTRLNSDAISINYTSTSTIITRYMINGNIEYKFDVYVGVYENDSKLFVFINNDGSLSTSELVLPKDLFKNTIEDEFYILDTKVKNHETKAVVTNKIINQNYGKNNAKLFKSIDDYLISSALIPFRHENYTLSELSILPGDNDTTFPNITHGNLYIYIEDNKLKMIPKVIQNKVKGNDDVPNNVRNYYNTVSQDEFVSTHDSIKTYLDTIYNNFPDLISAKQSETDVYKLFFPNDDAIKILRNNIKYKEYKNIMENIIKENGISTNNINIEIVLDEKLFTTMLVFFRNRDINEHLYNLYNNYHIKETKFLNENDPLNKSPDPEIYYNAILKLAPSLYPLKKSTADLFIYLSELINIIKDEDRRQKELNTNSRSGNQYVDNQYSHLVQILNKRINDEDENQEFINNIMLFLKFYDLVDLNNEIDISNFSTFSKFKDRVLKYGTDILNAMSSIINYQNVESDKTLNEMRKSIKDDMIRYYALSNNYIRAEKNITDDSSKNVSMCSFVLNSKTPLLYRSENENTDEINNLEDILKNNLRQHVTLDFNIIELNELSSIINNEYVTTYKLELENILLNLKYRFNNYGTFDYDLIIKKIKDEKFDLNKLLKSLENNNNIIKKISKIKFDMAKETNTDKLQMFQNKYDSEYKRLSDEYKDLIDSVDINKIMEDIKLKIEKTNDNIDQLNKVNIIKNSDNFYFKSEYDGVEDIDNYLFNNFIITTELQFNLKEFNYFKEIINFQNNEDNEDQHLFNDENERIIFRECRNLIQKIDETIANREDLLKYDNQVKPVTEIINKYESEINIFNSNRQTLASSIYETIKDNESNLIEYSDIIQTVKETLITISKSDLNTIGKYKFNNIDYGIKQTKFLINVLNNSHNKNNNKVKRLYDSFKLIISMFNEAIQMYKISKERDILIKNVSLFSPIISKSSKTLNNIILDVLSIKDITPEQINSFLTYVYVNDKENSLLTTGIDSEIYVKHFPKGQNYNGLKDKQDDTKQKRVNNKEMKGKLQGKKGDDDYDNYESTEILINNNNLALVELNQLTTFQVPSYINVFKNGEIYAFTRDAYKADLAGEIYYEYCRYIISDDIDLTTDKSKTIINRICADLYSSIEERLKNTSKISNAYDAYDNLIYLNLYDDMLNLLKDIQSKNILFNPIDESNENTKYSANEIANFLLKIGNIIFNENISNKYSNLPEVSEYSINQIMDLIPENRTNIIDDIQFFIKDDINIFNIEEYMIDILYKDSRIVVNRMYIENPSEIPKIEGGLDFIRTSNLFTTIGDYQKEFIDRVVSSSENYTRFINMKKQLINEFNLGYNEFTTPFSIIVSTITGTNISNIDALKWYLIYGQTPLFSNSFPSEYKDYHVKSIYDKVNVTLNKIINKQYRTVKHTLKQLEFKSLLSSLVEEYTFTNNNEDKFVNELCITFKNKIKFSNLSSNTNDENNSIKLEFVKDDNTFSDFDRNTFTINLEDIFEKFISANSNNFVYNANEILLECEIDLNDIRDKKSNKLSLTPDFISKFKGAYFDSDEYNSLRINNKSVLNTSMISKVDIKSKWENDYRIKGIRIGNEIYNINVSSNIDLSSFDKIIYNGSKNFGHNGLIPVSNIKIIYGRAGVSHIFIISGNEYICKYYDVINYNRVTAFEFEPIIPGERLIYLSKFHYDKVESIDGIIYVTIKDVKSRLNDIRKDTTAIYPINPNSFDNVEYNQYKMVSSFGYVAVKANYISTNKTGDKQFYGSSIKIMSSDESSYNKYMNLTFPDIKIIDFNFIPPSNNIGASLIIVGRTNDMDGTKRLRIGYLELPNIKNSSYIVESFTNEYNFKNEPYNTITNIQLKGISTTYVYFDVSKDKQKQSKLFINNGSDDQYVLPFNTTGNKISISKDEKYISIYNDNSTTVVNSFGNIVDSTSGSGMFI